MVPKSSHKTVEDETLRALKEGLELRKQFAKGIGNASDSTNTVRSMSRDNSKSGVVSALKKTGVALIALPDPVTGVVGVPVLAAGVALEKLSKRELMLPQVSRELARTIKDLERLRRQGLR